ncbi:hypothetical protein LTR27_010409 [Elasticomyces elasticus]|nr:hypothetical protein LTR27_010409 [Elasticomyces elasticus]
MRFPIDYIPDFRNLHMRRIEPYEMISNRSFVLPSRPRNPGTFVRNFQYILLDRLSQHPSHAHPRPLPVELVVKILEFVLLEQQQLAIVSRTPPPSYGATRHPQAQSLEDPYTRLCLKLFRGLRVFQSRALEPIAREAYYNVNTVRLDIPSKHVCGKAPLLYAVRFASDIKYVQLNVNYVANTLAPLGAVGTFEELYRGLRERLHEFYVGAMVSMVKEVAGHMPSLKTFRLVLTFEPREDAWRHLRHDGSLCCMLLNKASGFVEAWTDRVAPALRSLAVGVVEYRWRVGCEHSECVSFAKRMMMDGSGGETGLKQADTWSSAKEDGYFVVVLGKSKAAAA